MAQEPFYPDQVVAQRSNEERQMSAEREKLLARIAELDEEALSKETRQLKARLLQIQAAASEIAAEADNDSAELKAANLAEEACQHALRLVELGG